MCDTIAIVLPDQVLFAKNSDRDPNEAQLLDWQPRLEHAAKKSLRCTWIDIPQVRRTYAVLLSRPFWIWGAEMGTNEHGVMIGNEAVFTRSPYAKIGLTGMDLVRLGLERAQTAPEACEVMTRLLQEYGQGGRCGLEDKTFTYHNSFLIADTREAYVLETAGRLWATEQVRGARAISNGLTIPGFADQNSDWIKTRVSGCCLRRSRTQSLAADVRSPLKLFALLRDHGGADCLPGYSWINAGLNAPCVHGGGLITSSQTTASWVAVLRPGACQHWVTATAAPCTALFKPVRVEDPIVQGPEPTDRADDKSLWWRHERLSRRVLKNPGELGPVYQSQRDQVEAQWVANIPDSRQAFAQGDALVAEWTNVVKAKSAEDTRPWWVRRYWARRNRWAGLCVD